MMWTSEPPHWLDIAFGDGDSGPSGCSGRTMQDGNRVVPDRATATPLDHLIIAATSLLPNNWLGLRLAILLRRAVTMRLPDDAGIDVERWGLHMRLHPRHSGCEKGLLFTAQVYWGD